MGGGLVRRLGATRTSQLALWLVAAGCGLSALGTMAALGAGAIVIGLGYGMTNPAASHLLSRAPTARNMNLIFSIKQCGVPIGGVLAGVMVPPLTLAMSWQAALLACALLNVGWSLLVGRHRPAWDTDRERSARLFAAPFASLGLLWRNTTMRWLALGSLVFSAVQLCLTGFLVTYLVAEVGMDLVLAGTILAVTHSAGAAGRLSWGWIADRLKSGTLALITNGSVAVAGALATAAVAADWPVWLVAAATALFGFCVMGWNGVFMAVIVRQSPHAVGSMTGATLSITYAGIVLGPTLFGALHDKAGLSYSGGFALLALVAAAGVGLFRSGAPQRRPLSGEFPPQPVAQRGEPGMLRKQAPVHDDHRRQRYGGLHGEPSDPPRSDRVLRAAQRAAPPRPARPPRPRPGS